MSKGKPVPLSKPQKIVAAISLVVMAVGAILSRFAFAGLPLDLISFGLMAVGGFPLLVIFAIGRSKENEALEKTHELHYSPENNEYQRQKRPSQGDSAANN